VAHSNRTDCFDDNKTTIGTLFTRKVWNAARPFDKLARNKSTRSLHINPCKMLDVQSRLTIAVQRQLQILTYRLDCSCRILPSKMHSFVSCVAMNPIYFPFGGGGSKLTVLDISVHSWVLHLIRAKMVAETLTGQKSGYPVELCVTVASRSSVEEAERTAVLWNPKKNTDADNDSAHFDDSNVNSDA
jgi:hypothetical protein